MATVKRKHSRARGRTRRAGHPKLATPATRACTKCGELMLSHRVCPSCGTYRSKSLKAEGEA